MLGKETHFQALECSGGNGKQDLLSCKSSLHIKLTFVSLGLILENKANVELSQTASLQIDTHGLEMKNDFRET